MNEKMQNAESRASLLLVASAVLVGIAIALDGPVSRAINGVAGIGWFLAAALLVRSNMRKPCGWKVIANAVAVGLVLVLAVKPSDFAWAVVGFTIGGAIVAYSATSDRAKAALVLPALWLPIHLLVAVGRAIDRAIRDLPANVRTDPPPTAALVPLAMVVAAFVGGLIVQWVTGMKANSKVKASPIG